MSSQCPVCGAVIAEDCGSLEQPDERAIVPTINTNTTAPVPTSGAYSKYPVIDNAVLALVR